MAAMHERIREARRRVGVSQEEFAAALKVSRGAVAQWEMVDGTTPAVKNIEHIATLSGLCFEWVATGRGAKIFGEAMLREESPSYGMALSDDELAVVKAMRKMKPPQRAAFVRFINP